MKTNGKQCVHVLKDGSRCHAWALKGCNLCFNHNPSTKTDKLKAVRKGGLANRIGVDVPLQKVEVKCPADVVTLLVVVIDELRAGKIAPQVANTLGFLGSQLLRAFEVSALEEKLTEIKTVILQRKIVK